MESEICSMCKVEKNIKSVHKKYSQCEDCNNKRGLKRYYENKDKISIQRTIYFEKKDKLLQRQNDRYIQFEEVVRSYVEFETRLKTLEEKTDNTSS